MHETFKTILAAKAPDPKPLEMPEWGVRLYVRVMSGSQRDAFEMAVDSGRRSGSTMLAKQTLLLACLVDEDGKPILKDLAEAKQLITEASGNSIEQVLTFCQGVNALTGVEEAAKN